MTAGSTPLLEAPFRLPEAPVEADLVAKYFRGLGEPTRLRILELLRDEGELSVGALVQRLGVPQPKALGREVEVPVCYEPQFALDLEEIAAKTRQPAEKVAALHCASAGH